MPGGSMIGGAGALLGAGFSENPYTQAIGTYDQFPGVAHELLDPYVAAGRQALPVYGQQIGKGIYSPWELQDRIMLHYQQSPWATEQMRATTRAMQNAAAAEGGLGSPNERLALQGRLRGIVSQDQQNYLQNAMEPYRMAMGGLQYGVGLGGQTARFGTQMANQYLQNLAALQAAQGQFENQRLGGAIGGVTGIAGGLT